MRYFTIVIACLAFSASADLRSDEVAKADQATDLVYQGIADLSLLRDSVLKRYALMVTGESQRIPDPNNSSRSVMHDRIYKLKAGHSARKFKYSASGQVMGLERSTRPDEYQIWGELLQCGSVTKGRNGIATTQGYTTRKKEETLNHFAEKLGVDWTRFDPFDVLVLHAMFLKHPMSQAGWIEKVYLRESELISAEEIVQGDIRSVWHWKNQLLDFEIELVQSKAHDYMPTQVKYTSTDPKTVTNFGETEIKWKKHARSNKYLPHIVKASRGSLYGQSKQQHQWVFDWRIGKEVPDNFFDCSSEDFRLQFTPLFDFEFDMAVDRRGKILGTPWKSPEELSAK